jgi:hypothetical protein
MVLLLAGPASAGVEKLSTEGELARAYAEWSLSQNDAPGARKGLVEHLARHPADSETQGALAVVEGKLGNWKAADAAFAKAAAGAPSPAVRARWLRAQAGARDKLGDASGALALRKEASELLRASASAPAEGGTDLGLEVSARSGYDTNVLLVSDPTLTTTAVSGQASPVVGADAALSARRKRAGGGKVAFSAGTSVNWYTGEKTSQFGSVAGRAGARLDAADGASVAADASIVLLNRSGLGFYSFGAGLEAEQEVAKHGFGAVTLGGALRIQDISETGVSPALDRDGTVLGARARLDHKVGGAQTLASTLGLERAFTEGNQYDAMAVSLQSAWSRQLTKSDRLLAGLRVARTDYLLSTESRGDWGLMLSPGLNHAFGERTRAFLVYMMNLNRSNVADARYSKHMVLLQVSHEIF